MKDVPVRLDYHEFLFAATVGCMRQIENIMAGRHDMYGAAPGDGWALHVRGACGELAVAKVLGKYWSGNLGDLKAADVGPYQVRHSARPGAPLRLHRRDRDQDVFLLVTGDPPNLCVRGWLQACEGKVEGFWSDPTGQDRPAYFVPQEFLRDLEDLP